MVQVIGFLSDPAEHVFHGIWRVTGPPAHSERGYSDSYGVSQAKYLTSAYSGNWQSGYIDTLA